MSSILTKIILPMAIATGGVFFAQSNVVQKPGIIDQNNTKTALILKKDTVELKSSSAPKMLCWEKARAYNEKEDQAFIEIMSTSTGECKKLNERFLKLSEKYTRNFWQNHLDSLKRAGNFVKSIKR